MKSLTDKAREYALKKHGGHEMFLTDRSESRIDFLAGAKEAQIWISIEEELPEIDQRVLVKHEGGIVCTGYFTGLYWVIWGEESKTGRQYPEYWRPIELK